MYGQNKSDTAIENSKVAVKKPTVRGADIANDTNALSLASWGAVYDCLLTTNAKAIAVPSTTDADVGKQIVINFVAAIAAGGDPTFTLGSGDVFSQASYQNGTGVTEFHPPLTTDNTFSIEGEGTNGGVAVTSSFTMTVLAKGSVLLEANWVHKGTGSAAAAWTTV